tara:strand:+ start:303 stop:551 length:249 start_codon:yes stop_codon:yes gene_type:complete
MTDKKLTFGEVWCKLTSEDAEYLKNFIENQKKAAVEHYKKEQLRLHSVVKPFYCYDKKYVKNGDKCKNQCKTCSYVEVNGEQ